MYNRREKEKHGKEEEILDSMCGLQLGDVYDDRVRIKNADKQIRKYQNRSYIV